VYAAELEKKVHSRTEALHKTIKELEVEVVERKRAEEEVRKSLEKERELNELKSKFVSIASHEFRTPLSTVLSSAALISQYNERGESSKIEKHVQRIKTSVNHLTSILNDFLSLGKLEEGVVEIAKKEIDLADFITGITEELQETLKPGQELKVLNDNGEKTVDSDPRILRNILFNLISNASKYSDAGKSIHLTLKKAGKDFIFKIIDEGIGIPQEDQRHLFQRFYRASNAGNIQGTGLGLNIVRRYVDLLDGKIEFESQPGKGSTFTVSIPT
jgi:signal transduction histidine kinase